MAADPVTPPAPKSLFWPTLVSFAMLLGALPSGLALAVPDSDLTFIRLAGYSLALGALAGIPWALWFDARSHGRGRRHLLLGLSLAFPVAVVALGYILLPSTNPEGSGQFLLFCYIVAACLVLSMGLTALLRRFVFRRIPGVAHRIIFSLFGLEVLALLVAAIRG